MYGEHSTGARPRKGKGNTMTTISRNEAEKRVNDWNAHIANFMTNELPRILEERGVRVKNGKISMNDWFKANAIVNEQNFYKTGIEILRELRDAGYDVKMNMQSNELVFPRWM